MTAPYEKFAADCERCIHSERKSDRRRCTVKCIDCSVRKGRLPCSSFEERP